MEIKVGDMLSLSLSDLGSISVAETSATILTRVQRQLPGWRR